ncbi:unnamed protein product [Rhizophagus irregularis]|nr:unnamed protein product [Rhizophagus irregularis]
MKINKWNNEIYLNENRETSRKIKFIRETWLKCPNKSKEIDPQGHSWTIKLVYPTERIKKRYQIFYYFIYPFYFLLV